MVTRVLLVGIATDGPELKVSLNKDERSLLRLYGGLLTERHTLTAQATSLSLMYEPLNVPTNVLNGSLYQYLYAPSVSGQTMFFGSVGGSGVQADVSYVPYLGKDDVLWAARKFMAETGAIPYVARMPGQRATLDVGLWKFSARYHGIKYNSVAVSYSSGGVFTVSGLEPNYPTLSYTVTTPLELLPLINRDFELGLSPLYVEQSVASLPTFSTNLTGGLDSAFSEASFSSMINTLTIPHDCSHVVFLTPLSSSYINTLATYFREEKVLPKMMLFPAPVMEGEAENYLLELGTLLPARHSMVGMVLGTVRQELNSRQVDRWAVEAALEGFVNARALNMTNLQIPGLSFSPYLTEAELDFMKLSGVMCVTRHIGRDPAVYQAVTSSRTESFLHSSKVAEIVALSVQYLTPYLGQVMSEGLNTKISEDLRQLLQNVNWVQIETVECVIIRDKIFISVYGYLPEEILSITFQVRNSR